MELRWAAETREASPLMVGRRLGSDGYKSGSDITAGAETSFPQLADQPPLSLFWVAMDLKTAAAEALRVSAEDGARVDALNRAAVAMRRSLRDGDVAPSFFEGFALRGIRVDAIRPGRILCSFTVPARLTTAAGNHLAPGAVVALVDEIGSAVSVADGKHLKVSVDMSVSLVDLAAAASGDALRITARALGHKGYYSGTHVLIANAATGKVVAEGRHSLFGKMKAAPPPGSTLIKSNI